MMTAIGVTRESERGTMETLLATPVRPLEVMIGKLAPYVLVGLIQAAVILIMAQAAVRGADGGRLGGAFARPVPVHHRHPVARLPDLDRRPQPVAGDADAVFYMLPSILLSGFMFPFRGMPEWAQWLGSIIPVTHLLRVVRGAMLKGVGISEALPSLGALTLFVLVVTALGDEAISDDAGLGALNLASVAQSATGAGFQRTALDCGRLPSGCRSDR